MFCPSPFDIVKSSSSNIDDNKPRSLVSPMNLRSETTLSAAYRATTVTFDSLIKKSKAMRELLAQAKTIAPSPVNVLLLGETGTGKNLIAQALHNESPRRNGPFVSLNCSAIPDSLLESELFGAEAGAFTDSKRSRKGRFELAHQGTLFLDEIGDLSPQAQAKILHAIEYREFTPVGSEKSLTSDVRLIAATHRSLEDDIRQGGFRQDLFYRLNEVTLCVPPLRERKDEIASLVNHFIQECNQKYQKKVKKADRALLKLLERYNWPGNVRELRSAIKRGVVSGGSDILRIEDLGLELHFSHHSGQNPEVDSAPDLSLAFAEKTHIRSVLDYTNWVKTEAARLLGISRPTLDRKIENYKLERSE